jgi:hypothetical protein
MSINLKFECYIAIVVGLVSGKTIRFNGNIDSQKTLFHNQCLLGGEILKGAVTCSKVFFPENGPKLSYLEWAKVVVMFRTIGPLHVASI